MLLEEFLTGRDVERIIVDSQNPSLIEKMHDSFEGSTSGSSNIQYVFDLHIALIPLPNQSVRVPM